MKSRATKKTSPAARATKVKSRPKKSAAKARAPRPKKVAGDDAARSSATDRRLDSILRALPEPELVALIERMGIRVDEKKRIDVPAQVARVLVRLPDVREPSRLPPVSAQLLRRIAEARGSLMVSTLPAGVEVLVRRGLVYARRCGDDVELMLPTAFLVQMKNWEGEDPRALRALLAEAPFETASAVASHFLGRPSTPPIALSLEPAWEVLGDREGLRAEVARVSHPERRLLDQLEQVGGEVDTQELMDLEREPMRVRGAYGVAAGRRGAAFSLEKRGLLFPLHPNRYVIPTEVAAIIGAERRKQRDQRREEIRSHVIEEDHLPRRARFSCDPAPLALAMAMALREGSVDLKPGLGTPRSLVARMAQRFGRQTQNAALVIALARAVGLWESGAVSVAAPPGSLRLCELTPLLFDTWRRGGAWDEARAEPEMLRLPQEQRDPSPVGVLREMVLDALQDLGEGQWVPYAALAAYLEDDPRAGGLRRLLERWAKRVGVSAPAEPDLVRQVLLDSLPSLGVVDLGGADVESAAGSGELAGLALRLTSRGRELICRDGSGSALELSSANRSASESQFVEPRLLQIGASARVADTLELGRFAELAGVDNVLELNVSSSAMSRGLAQGVEASEMRSRLEALVHLSEEISEALEQAGTIVGRATLAPAGGFLWIEDPDLREMLRSRQPAAELFVDPSPQGGLLVAQGVEPERVSRRCRALGVEVSIEEGIMRARRSTVPPPKRSETNRKTVSWRPPAARGRRRTGDS